jgi:hypothetical protein
MKQTVRQQVAAISIDDVIVDSRGIDATLTKIAGEMRQAVALIAIVDSYYKLLPGWGQCGTGAPRHRRGPGYVHCLADKALNVADAPRAKPGCGRRHPRELAAEFVRVGRDVAGIPVQVPAEAANRGDQILSPTNWDIGAAANVLDDVRTGS